MLELNLVYVSEWSQLCLTSIEIKATLKFSLAHEDEWRLNIQIMVHSISNVYLVHLGGPSLL